MDGEGGPQGGEARGRVARATPEESREQTTRRGGSGSRRPSPREATRGAQAREVGVKSPRASDRSRRGRTSQKGFSALTFRHLAGQPTRAGKPVLERSPTRCRVGRPMRAHLRVRRPFGAGVRFGKLAGCARGLSRLQKPSGSIRFSVSRGEEPWEPHRKSSSAVTLRDNLGGARSGEGVLMTRPAARYGASPLSSESFGKKAGVGPEGEGAQGRFEVRLDGRMERDPRRLG